MSNGRIHHKTAAEEKAIAGAYEIPDDWVEQDHLISIYGVMKLTGLSASGIRQKVRGNRLVAPYRWGRNHCRWSTREIANWIAQSEHIYVN